MATPTTAEVLALRTAWRTAIATNPAEADAAFALYANTAADLPEPELAALRARIPALKAADRAAASVEVAA